MIDEELKAILACPACRKAYPIRDEIPVMLINEAKAWEEQRRA